MRKYQKELAALQEYIAKFDPEEFTSPLEVALTLPRTPEQIAEVQRLKSRLKRRRQLADSFNLLIDNQELNGTEMIITQDEVDVLLAGWSLSHS